MKTIEVALPQGSYPIHIGRDLLHDKQLFAPLKGRQTVVISNDTVAPLYLDRVRAVLPVAPVSEVILPDGEQFKTIESWTRVHQQLASVPLARDGVLIALGGGVIGDMTGFAAATYMRGIDFLQIPTTLLAQVDASVGGKTGVNLPAGKNLVGAFHQPIGVVMDLTTLDTLPQREMAAGWAELIKMGMLWDRPLFEAAETHADPSSVAPDLLAQSVANKAEVVAQDEREQGIRALLNLGHTFAHAIESATSYQTYLHGEAVAIGLVAATRLSERMGLLDTELTDRVIALLNRYGLPTDCAGLEAEKLLDLMAADKKVLAGQLRFILLAKLGRGVIRADVSPAEVLRTLRDCGAH